MKQIDWWEIISDALLIAFGAVMIFIFLSIEVFGYYGVEGNRYVRWFELLLGMPLIVIGIDRLRRDI